MSELVAVIIGTYGQRMEWAPLVRRASDSVTAQTRPADIVVWKHADSLQHARNWGASEADKADWFIFLDADDELEPTYIEEMLKAGGDIRRPATRGVYEDGTIEDPPSIIPERILRDANYLVIGSMCRAELFFDVDGFADYPILEDWDLWQRMVLAGGTVVTVPGAVYRIHVRTGSRNMADTHRDVYTAIRQSHDDAWRTRS